MFNYVYIWWFVFTFLSHELLVLVLLRLPKFNHFYLCLHFFLPMCTPVYSCLLMFITVYLYFALLFMHVYPCLLVFTNVYLSLPMFTRVWCLPLFTTVYSSLTVYHSLLVHVYKCWPILTCLYLCLHLFSYVYPYLLVLTYDYSYLPV